MKKSIIITSIAVVAAVFLISLNVMCRGTEVNETTIATKKITLPNGVTLEYVERGDKNGTPIIFLHGYTDSWHSFEKVLSRFREAYHLIAISQRGHGDSDRPEKGYHPKDFAADVAEFIRQKNLGACVIVGHSLGGLISQQFALDYPQLTKGVVIVSSSPSFADNAGIPEFIGEVMKLTDPVERRFAEEFQRSTFVQPVAEEDVNLYINETAKVPARVWKAIGRELEEVDYKNVLDKITAPVLILWGTEDPYCPKEDQDQFLNGLPYAKIIIYDSTGHALHWERPEKFVDDVSAFAAKL